MDLRTIPHLEIWLPIIIGVSVGGVSLLVVRLLTQGSKKGRTLPPAPSAKQESTDYDPFIYGSSSEQRAAHRRGGAPVPIYVVPAGNAEVEPEHGWVIDRSVGGLRIALKKRLEPGTFWKVLPTNAPKSTPWVEVEIKNCRSRNDVFEMGCQFVKSPQWGTLLLFG